MQQQTFVEWLLSLNQEQKNISLDNAINTYFGKVLNIKETVITQILSVYGNMTPETLFSLIDATNVKGAKFISLKDYNSDKSENTELANYVVNIGISYENMLNKDSLTLHSYDIETVKDVLKEKVIAHNYGKYDLKKFADASQPYNEILDLLPTALIEMKQADQQPTDRANYNVKLNPVLWFNTSTNNLLIFGKKVSKETTVKGEYKKVASAPLTVAKNIIRDTLRKDDLRTFILDNVLTSLTSKGEVLELS
jgi:hypothetical protein